MEYFSFILLIWAGEKKNKKINKIWGKKSFGKKQQIWTQDDVQSSRTFLFPYLVNQSKHAEDKTEKTKP